MKVAYDSEQNIFVPSDNNILLPQIMWHITGECMLNCKMCFAKNQRFSNAVIDENTITRDLAFLSNLQVQKIDISGGEPLLCRCLVFLVNRAIEQGFSLTITTRGLGIKDNIDWLIVNWRLCSRIIISLDSYDELSNDSYVGYKGAFKGLISFINSLKEERCNNLRINTVVNQSILNLNHFGSVCKLVKSISPKEWCLIQPHPLNKKDSYNDYSVSGNEFREFVKQSKDALSDYKQINLLTRANDIYSTYWCLYPDNTIAQLSSGSDYRFRCELNAQNIKIIERVINSNVQILP